MAPEISVCMPVVYGTHLIESIESIIGNSFQDFEIVINDSSLSGEVHDILSRYDLKVIEKKTKSFESRYITVNSSRGRKVFLFDETRVMPKGLLEAVSSTDGDMITIKERDIGRGFLVYLSNLDKKGMPTNKEVMDPERNKSIIPRVYRRGVITKAIENVKKNLTEEIIREIVGLDLELIYFESYKITRDISIISSPEILHYGDERVADLFRKYYRYGNSQAMLRKTYYRALAGLSGRNRSTLPFINRIYSIPIQILRGIPFVLGYAIGRLG